MFPAPSGPDSPAARLARVAAQFRPSHLLATVALAGVVGMVGLQAVALPGPRPLTEAGRLKIELVQPIEPPIVEGSVMEVGELVEGFQGVPRGPAIQAVAYRPYEDADDWGDAPEPSPGSGRRIAEAVVVTSMPQPEASGDRARDRWFGFDAPRRDYRAEREARRARWESRPDRDDRAGRYAPDDRYEGDEREARSDPRDTPRRYRSDRGERDRRDGPVRYDRLAEAGWD